MNRLPQTNPTPAGEWFNYSHQKRSPGFCFIRRKKQKAVYAIGRNLKSKSCGRGSYLSKAQLGKRLRDTRKKDGSRSKEVDFMEAARLLTEIKMLQALKEDVLFSNSCSFVEYLRYISFIYAHSRKIIDKTLLIQV
jgi:hypothetical protein